MPREVFEELLRLARSEILDGLSGWLESHSSQIEIVLTTAGGCRCESTSAVKKIFIDESELEELNDIEVAALSVCGFEILRYRYFGGVLSYNNVVLQIFLHEVSHAVQMILWDTEDHNEDEFERYHNSDFYKVLNRLSISERGMTFVNEGRKLLGRISSDWTYPIIRASKIYSLHPGAQVSLEWRGSALNGEVISIGHSKAIVATELGDISIGIFGLNPISRECSK